MGTPLENYKKYKQNREVQTNQRKKEINSIINRGSNTATGSSDVGVYRTQKKEYNNVSGSTPLERYKSMKANKAKNIQERIDTNVKSNKNLNRSTSYVASSADKIKVDTDKARHRYSNTREQLENERKAIIEDMKKMGYDDKSIRAADRYMQGYSDNEGNTDKMFDNLNRYYEQFGDDFYKYQNVQKSDAHIQKNIDNAKDKATRDKWVDIQRTKTGIERQAAAKAEEQRRASWSVEDTQNEIRKKQEDIDLYKNIMNKYDELIAHNADSPEVGTWVEKYEETKKKYKESSRTKKEYEKLLKEKEVTTVMDAMTPEEKKQLEYIEAMYDKDRNSFYDPKYVQYEEELKEKGIDIDRLVNYIRDKRAAEVAEEKREYISNFADKHPVIGSAASIGATLLQPLDMIEVADAKLHGREINPDNMHVTQFKDTVTRTVSEGIDDTVLEFLYNTGMSIGDSALLLPTNMVVPGASVGIMGVNATASGIKNAKERGIEDKNALMTGIAQGIAEGFFEKISLGNLKALSAQKPDSVKTVIKNLLKQSGVEGSEEVFTDLANRITDDIINQDMSEYNQMVNNYYMAGYSKEDARKAADKEFLNQILQSFVGGAISGGVFGTGGTIAGAVNNRQKNMAAGRDIVNDGLIADEVNALASGMNVESVTQALEGFKEEGNVKNAAKLNKEITKATENKFKDVTNVAELNDVYSRIMEENTENEYAEKVTTEAYVSRARELAEDTKTPQEKAELYEAVNNMLEERENQNRINKVGSNYYEQIFKTNENKEQIDENVAKVDNSTLIPKNEENANENYAREVEKALRKAPAIALDTKSPVTVTGIAESNNADTKLKLSNGSQISIKDVQFNDSQTAEVYKRASNYNNNLYSTAYVGIYSGQDIEIYDSAFKSFTSAGKNNQSFNHVMQQLGIYREYISDSDLRNMYLVGQNYGKQISAITVSPKQQKLVKQLADTLNVKVEFVDTIQEGNTTANGKVEDGVIYIAKDSQNYAMSVFTHELTHVLKQSNEEGYQKYADFVLDYFKKEYASEYKKRFDRLVELYGEDNENYINEEMVCNATEAMLTDVDFIEEVALAQPNTVQKIVEVIKNMINKLKSLYKNYAPTSEEGKMLAADLETLKKAEKLWVEALGKVGENKGKGNETRFSLMEFVKDGKRYVEINQEQKRFEGKDRKDYPQIAKEIINERFNGKVIGITHRMFVNGGGRDEYSHPSKPIKEDYIYDAKMRASAELDNMLEAGEKLPNEPDGRDGHVHKDTEEWEYYKTLFKVDEYYFEGVINIQNISRGKLFKDVTKIKDVTEAIMSSYGKNPKSQFLRTSSINDSVAKNNDSVNKKSIKEDNQRNVLSEQQQNYFVDSKVRDDKGRLKVMYHGTPESFTVFDRKKAKYSGLYGRGFYFTESNSHASQYGKQMEVYLNIKNPVSTTETTITKRQLEKFLAEVKANEDDYSFENYGYDATVESVADSIYGKSDFDMIYDIDQTAIGNMVETVELFNKINGTSYDGFILSTETVVFNSNQIKNIDNTNPTDNPDIRFSLKETSDIKDFDMDTKKEESILSGAFERIRGQRVDDITVRQVAERLLKEYESKYPQGTFRDNIEKVFNYIQRNENVSYRDMLQIMSEIAKPVIEKSTKVDASTEKAYKALSKYLRNSDIMLTEDQKAHVTRYVGNYDNYRKNLYGKINLEENGEYLEEIWPELVEMSDGFLSEDVKPNDMIYELESTLETLRPKYNSEYGQNTDEAAYDLALRIYEEYFKSQKKMEVKKYSEEIREQLNRVREATADAYEDRIRQVKESEYKRRVRMEHKLREQKDKDYEKRKELRMKNQDKIAELKAKNKETVAEIRKNNKESELKKKYRKSVLQKVEKMYNMLVNPTDARHIPDMVRDKILNFVTKIDFTPKLKGTETEEKWKDIMRDLKDEVTKLERGDYQSVYIDLDPDYLYRLDEYIRDYGNVEFTMLDIDGLQELEYLVSILSKCITHSNKLIENARYNDIASVGNDSIMQMSARKRKNAHSKTIELVDNIINLDLLEPQTYFKKIGPAAESIYDELRKGFDKRVWRLKEAKDYMEEATKGLSKKQMSEITGANAKIYDFDGIKMTKAQIMSLYCLNKRAQARSHIYSPDKGGIKIDKIHAEKKLAEQDKKNVSKQKVKEIINTLTPEEKALADKMQQFMANQCSEWGNEVSKKLYDYSKFTEKDYFPIKSSSAYVATLNSDDGKTNLYRVKNQGFTKQLVEKANNPIMISDIFDVFTKHVTGMADYNALSIPLADAMKWYNYTEADNSVKSMMQSRMGDAALRYFINLMEQLNNASATPFGEDMATNLMSNYKAAAIGMNMRVVIQQPTSYVRAMNEISPKYLMIGMAQPWSVKSGMKKAKANSAIALWKSWGFYETMIGKSLRGLITGQMSTREKIREISGALAGFMDEVTWGTLWNACEAETRAKYKDLSKEEITEKTAERLNEIIDKTQVVDTVIHKTQAGRSQSSMAKMAHAFMSEPYKAYNMLYRAFDVASHDKSKKNMELLGRAAMTYLVANVVTGAAAGIVDAFRDDDEYESWIEKYLEALKKNIVSNINPLGMIPYVKDIISIIQGYDVDRMDMAAIANIFHYGQKFIENPSTQNLVGLARGTSQLVGIPIGNIYREIDTIKRAITGTGFLDETTAKEHYDEMYKLISEGKVEEAEKIKEKLYKLGKKYSTIASAIRTRLAENDERIIKAAEAKMEGSKEYKNIVKDIAKDGFSESDIVAAVNKIINQREQENDKEEPKESDVEESYSIYEYSDIQSALDGNDYDYANEIIEDIYRTKVNNGKEPNKVMTTIKSQITKMYKEQYQTGSNKEKLAIISKLEKVKINGKRIIEPKDFQNWNKG